MPIRTALATGIVAAAVVSLFAPTAADAATKPVTKPVTIAAAPRAMTYGGSEPALSYSVTGLAKGEALTRRPTCAVPAHRNVGTYPITCSGAAADAKKYTLRYAPATLTVGRAPLAIAANYTQRTYTDTEPTTFAYTVTGLVRGDELTTSPRCDVAGPHANAGRYAITCSGADAGPNYTIRYFDHYYVVTRSVVLVGPYAQAVPYGGDDPDFTYAVAGLKQGERLVAEPSCGVEGEHEHAGTYQIDCTGAAVSDNYALRLLPNQYVVHQTTSVIKGEQPTYTRDLLRRPTGAKLTARLGAYLGSFYALSPLPGAPVTFTSGDTTLCTATTDSAGQATCSVTKSLVSLVEHNGYTVGYLGDGDIAGATHDVDAA